tara:strand:- start:237 stop:566 length:330 start_codon:yes stop_codon:yes gene_type:complete
MVRDTPQKLQKIVQKMSENLENPLLITEISKSVGISVRQAERLFLKHLDSSPKAYYRKLRLHHSRMLVEQTSMSILEISLACGFFNRRTFTQYYREEFGFPPTNTRRTP